MNLGPESKILIVDDSRSMRGLLKLLFKQLGFTQNIEEAENGQVAWDRIQKGDIKFDLILADWMMPGLTGIELLKNIRTDKTLTSTPFILITAETEKERHEQAKREGADDFITKPFVSDQLRTALNNISTRSPSA